MGFATFQLELDGATVTYGGGGKLGSGADSVILPGTLTTTSGEMHDVAIKVSCTVSPREAERWEVETKYMLSVPEHPNIVKIYGSLVKEPPSPNHLQYDAYVITERMEQTLDEFYFPGPAGGGFGSTCTFGDVVEIFMGICKGLQHLHKHGLIHYDLKPGNILISHTQQVKIADFGSSKVTTDSLGSCIPSFRGTMSYMAPEIAHQHLKFHRGEKHARVSQAIDIYSLGCLMWECLNFCKMGDKTNQKHTSGRLIKWGRAVDTPDVWCDGPAELCDLVESCLRFSTNNSKTSWYGRPKAKDIQKTLKGILDKSWMSAKISGYVEEPQATMKEGNGILNAILPRFLFKRKRMNHADKLLQATQMGDCTEVNKLLNQDASSASATNKKSQKNSALHYAAEQNFGNIVKLLLEAGAKVDARNQNGNTPLMSAASCGHMQIVEELLQAGANVQATNNKGQNPWGIAAAHGHSKVLGVISSVTCK